MNARAPRISPRHSLASAWCLLLVGCSGSALEPTALDLSVKGTATPQLVLADGTELVLTEARMAFGPLTLCPATQSGALCATARLEWRDAAIVDLLNPNPQLIGRLTGTTGTVRSYMYDLGYASLLTQPEPLALDAVEQLEDASLLIHGSAEVPGETPRVPFVVHLAAMQSSDVDRGQPVVRLTAPPGLPRDVTLATQQLALTFQLADLLSGLDRSDFFQDEPCADEGIVCQGSIAQDCGTRERSDCADTQQICAPDQGCADVIALTTDSLGGRGILQRLVAGTPPSLDWED